jgi:outer membrane lipoprotein SlyB
MKVLIPLILVIITSCSSNPKLYPNEKYKSVGKEVAQTDIDQCMEEAENFLESGKGKQIAKSAGKGAAITGAMGAALGLITGDILGSAATGAAMGAAGGAASGALSPDEIKQRYVNECLSQKGYRVLGWD